MNYWFYIYLFVIFSAGIFTEKSFAMDEEFIENQCIADVIKIKADEGKIVSSRGLIKTCRFLAKYWIKNGEVAPANITPGYSQVNASEMRELFYGEW